RRDAGAEQPDAEDEEVQPSDPFDDREPERGGRKQRAEAQQRRHERRRIAQRNGGDERDIGAAAVRQRIADHRQDRRPGNDEQDRRSGDEGEPELDGHGGQPSTTSDGLYFSEAER